MDRLAPGSILSVRSGSGRRTGLSTAVRSGFGRAAASQHGGPIRLRAGAGPGTGFRSDPAGAAARNTAVRSGSGRGPGTGLRSGSGRAAERNTAVPSGSGAGSGAPAPPDRPPAGLRLGAAGALRPVCAGDPALRGATGAGRGRGPVPGPCRAPACRRGHPRLRRRGWRTGRAGRGTTDPERHRPGGTQRRSAPHPRGAPPPAPRRAWGGCPRPAGDRTPPTAPRRPAGSGTIRRPERSRAARRAPRRPSPAPDASPTPSPRSPGAPSPRTRPW